MLDKWRTLIKSRRLGDTSVSELYDVEFMCKDRRIIWVEVSTKPVFKKNTLVGYIGTARDISEKKEYRQELNRYAEELKNTNCKLEELANFDTHQLRSSLL
ncbi:MAG TPA: PAS domain S-box protein [Negativicutes bacterium]|nr:PAS domain S-box protein [Negativicutes bacterium]